MDIENARIQIVSQNIMALNNWAYASCALDMGVVGNKSSKRSRHWNIALLHVLRKLRRQEFQNAKEREELEFNLKVMAKQRCMKSLRTPPFEYVDFGWHNFLITSCI